MNAVYNVFTDGGEGTTGLRIHEYLSFRDDINILRLDGDKRKNIDERIKMIEKADISILCLPDDASREIVSHVSKDAVLLDTSTAHRTAGGWIYGLPELSLRHKEEIAASKRVAVPGCHATGFVLIAEPLVSEGIAGDDYPFVCHSVTGYSGGGKKMIAEYESDGAGAEYLSPRQYGLSQGHKHIPEMTAIPGLRYAPVFVPVVGNFYCGMVVSVSLITRLLKKRTGVDEVREVFRRKYEDCGMIEVLDAAGPEGGFLGANNMSCRNTVQIFVYGNDDNIIISARYDNLGKGAAGGAVQCMNIMLGLDEEKGLIPTRI